MRPSTLHAGYYLRCPSLRSVPAAAVLEARSARSKRWTSACASFRWARLAAAMGGETAGGRLGHASFSGASRNGLRSRTRSATRGGLRKRGTAPVARGGLAPRAGGPARGPVAAVLLALRTAERAAVAVGTGLPRRRPAWLGPGARPGRGLRRGGSKPVALGGLPRTQRAGLAALSGGGLPRARLSGLTTRGRSGLGAVPAVSCNR